MIALLATMLGSQALAQGYPTRVDPAYLDYVDLLEEMQELPLGPPPAYELGDGVVWLRDMRGTRLGTIFVDGPSNQKRERWFWPAVPHPGASFQFEHQGLYADGGEPDLLDDFDVDYQLNPCATMWLSYTDLPDPLDTMEMTYGPDIDRYHFDLYRPVWDPMANAFVDLHVGELLREYHHVPNMPARYFEHWAFLDDFVFPQVLGDTLKVTYSPVQYTTTADYFDELDYFDPKWDKFAQTSFETKTYAQCMGMLNP